MNLTMQQPMHYPYYIGSPRHPFAVPWSPNPFHMPPSPYQPSSSLPPISYPVPFILSHPPRKNFPPKPIQTFSSYTNTRYNHLKQSTSHINRHRPMDTLLQSQRYTIPSQQYRPLKTKSVSDFQQLSQQNATHLFKAHSWHSINHLHQSNSNINPHHYHHHHSTQQTHAFHDKHHHPHHHHYHHPHHHHYHHPHQRQYSPQTEKKSHRRHLSSSSTSSSSKQQSEQGLVRISTLDEMPMMKNPLYHENCPKPTNQRNGKKQLPSPSSTTSSHSSFQKRLNGSLRNDPLLIAAMEDFRQLRRTPSQSTTLTPQQRELSRDSLCTNSTHNSSSSVSSARSRNHSQSSFTSLERLEIRNLIKTLKTNGLQTIQIPIQLTSSLVSTTTTSEPCSTHNSLSILNNKPKRSSITEELDREFNKLRLNNPKEDLIYVKPSSIHKQKPTTTIPPLPTLNELVEKVQHMQTFQQSPEEKTYENPIIRISVPQSSPMLSASNEKSILPNKNEYAVPIKKHSEVNLRSIIKKDEQIRSFSFCKPIDDLVNETHPAPPPLPPTTRPVSMFNWFQYGLTNPYPSSSSTTTFQPNRIQNNDNCQYDKSLVKENIYASDIDVHYPLAEENDYLKNDILIKDYLIDYKEKTHHNSTLFNDFSRIFTRFGNHKHEQKRKVHHNKNNQNLRCSIM